MFPATDFTVTPPISPNPSTHSTNSKNNNEDKDEECDKPNSNSIKIDRAALDKSLNPQRSFIARRTLPND